MRLKLFVSVTAILAISACSRPETIDSTLKITLPTANQLYAKQGELQTSATFPVGKIVCLSAVITAPDIKNAELSCGPSTTIAAGYFQVSGQEINTELKVPYGKDRTLTIYAYLLETGSCPDIGANVDTAKLYQVGVVTGIEINQPASAVEVTISYPGDGNNLVNRFASSCTNNSTIKVVNGRLSHGWSAVSLSAGKTIHSRLTDTPTKYINQ